MKKLQPLCLLLIMWQGVSAQEADTTRPWSFGGVAQLNFSQVSLTNWNAGGQSSISGTGLFNLFAKYNKDRTSWENTLNLAYGLVRQSGQEVIKSDDRIELDSKYGYKATEKLYYSFLMNFRTQFDEGLDYDSDTSKISEFFAPAYLLLAIGMDYKPSENFSLFVSPGTWKGTFVMNDRLADAGAFGVDPAEFDPFGNKTTDGQKLRSEFGGYINLAYARKVMENVTFSTKLNVFANYQDNFGNLDINWETLLSMKVNKFISASIATNLIYDDDIDIGIDEDDDGEIDKVGPRTQFKQVLAIGLSYQF